MSEVIHLLRQERSAIGLDGSEIVPPNVRAVAVLFLSNGRNAWHSTWSMTYRDGDFFRDGRKVSETVERRKTRGTVFYLDVLPAFQINYGDRKFLLTEINTFTPFRHINLIAARYEFVAQNLEGFLKLVQPPSILWKPSQSAVNRIILQEVSENYIDMTSYAMLSRGIDRHYNPPIGRYHRNITGTFAGESEWCWCDRELPTKMSLRSYNKALEALMEGTERLAAHLKVYPAKAR